MGSALEKEREGGRRRDKDGIGGEEQRESSFFFSLLPPSSAHCSRVRTEEQQVPLPFSAINSPVSFSLTAPPLPFCSLFLSQGNSTLLLSAYLKPVTRNGYAKVT